MGPVSISAIFLCQQYLLTLVLSVSGDNERARPYL